MLTLLLNIIENDEDRNKMERLYCLYAAKLVYYAEGITKDSQEAESIVQTAYEKAIIILDKIGDPEADETYGLFLTIVKNLCCDYLRKRRRTEIVDFSALEFEIPNVQTHNPEDMHIEKEAYFEKIEIIDTLPGELRTVLLLRILHGLSIKQIAVMMDLSTNVVSVRLSRAKKRLMKEMRYIMKEELKQYESKEQ